MARPGNNDMSRRRSKFVTFGKDDFVFEAEQRGFTVEVVRHKRDGWNDSRQFFAVKGEQRVDCGEVFKGEKADWNRAADAVMFAK